MWREPSAGGLCWCRGSGGKQRVRAGQAHTAGLLRPISFLRRGLAGKVAQLCAVGSVQLVPSAVARPAPGVTSRPRPVRAVAARLRFCPATACASVRQRRRWVRQNPPPPLTKKCRISLLESVGCGVRWKAHRPNNPFLRASIITTLSHIVCATKKDFGFGANKRRKPSLHGTL